MLDVFNIPGQQDSVKIFYAGGGTNDWQTMPYNFLGLLSLFLQPLLQTLLQPLLQPIILVLVYCEISSNVFLV